MTLRMAVDAVEEPEVDVVDGLPVLEAVDEVEGAPPMPLMAGRRSSIGPVGISTGWAPSSRARA